MKILSIDGGGIRGIIPAILLADLERRTGKPCAKLFDLVAGTSTGAILACGIGIGIPMAEMVEFYAEDGPKIFRKRAVFGSGLVIPKYPAEPMERALGQRFGANCLSDCYCDIIVPCFDHVLRKAVFWTSREPRRGDRKDDLALAEAVRASSSAPVYFPSADARYHDGGVMGANNPAMYAIVEAIAKGTRIEDVSLLSLGTGARPPGWMDLGWEGAAGVVAHLPDIFLEAGADAQDYQCRQFLGERYWRIQPQLGSVSSRMDDASEAHLRELMEVARGELPLSNLKLREWGLC